MGLYTLAMDTSTSHGSVAVLEDGAPIFAEAFVSERGHSSLLFALLERARAVAPRFHQIAVGLGPGSYAGIRISISAGIGLQLAMGAELVGIPSVAALAVAEPRYVAIGDARRDTFYWSLVDEGVCLQGPELIPADELTARLATVDCPVIAGEPLALAPAARIAFPSALTLAHLAAGDRGIIARETLEPLYLREAHITQPKVVPIFGGKPSA